MEDQPRQRFSLSRKQLAGLVYVGIAVLAAASSMYQTSASVQWYAAASNLTLHVEKVDFHLDGQPLGYPYLTIAATVENPLGYNGLRLTDVTYSVFVNSTSEAFMVQDSSEVAIRHIEFQREVSSRGSLNLSFAFQVLTDVVQPLQTFLNKHETDLVLYVGVIVSLNSVYGRFSIPYCYQLPGEIFTSCPAPRTSSGGRPGG